jgi:gas vesicle protein
MKGFKNENNSGSILISFLAGGLVGAGLALLFAPKPGRELRKDITDIAVDAREKAAEVVDQGKDLYEGGVTAVKTALGAAKTAYIEERDKHHQAA